MNRRRGPMFAGLAAGAVTLGASEVLAAILARTVGTAGTPSPLLAVGAAAVDLTPAWLKDWAVAAFGTADKLALFIGMGIVLAAAFALIGMLAPRRTGIALAGVSALAVGTRRRPGRCGHGPVPQRRRLDRWDTSGGAHR